MMRMVYVAAGVMLVAVVLVLAGIVAARFHDGPVEIVAGGAFRSGEPYAGPEEPDWSFLRDYSTVEFQLLDPPRSRTTWVMTYNGRLFIISGYMNTWFGRLWKHWPMQAEADGRMILRVDGTLYERQMVRIHDGDAVDPVLAELGRKYFGGPPVSREQVDSGNIWVFEVLPRG